MQITFLLLLLWISVNGRLCLLIVFSFLFSFSVRYFAYCDNITSLEVQIFTIEMVTNPKQEMKTQLFQLSHSLIIRNRKVRMCSHFDLLCCVFLFFLFLFLILHSARFTVTKIIFPILKFIQFLWITFEPLFIGVVWALLNMTRFVSPFWHRLNGT